VVMYDDDGGERANSRVMMTRNRLGSEGGGRCVSRA